MLVRGNASLIVSASPIASRFLAFGVNLTGKSIEIVHMDNRLICSFFLLFPVFGRATQESSGRNVIPQQLFLSIVGILMPELGSMFGTADRIVS